MIIIIVCLCFLLSTNVVYADNSDTIDELFDLYDRQDMYENLSMYREWLSIKKTYDGLLSELEMVNMFNEFYELALSIQEGKIKTCYDNIDLIIADNYEIEDMFASSIMFHPSTLISWDSRYKVNVEHINKYTEELNSYTIPSNRVFDYTQLDEISSKLESFDSDIESIKVVNLSLLKPPIENYSIDAGFGIRYSSALNAVIRNNGVDMCSQDTSVRSVLAGDVLSVGESPVDGRFVVVDNGSGVKTYYSNLAHIYVDVGDRIQQNSLLGSVGKRYNRDMLHFAMYFNNIPVNPEVLLGVVNKNEN